MLSGTTFLPRFVHSLSPDTALCTIAVSGAFHFTNRSPIFSTIGEPEAPYGGVQDAQQSIFKEAEKMRRNTPCYPYVALPAGEKRAFCDHVINKISSMFAVQHVLADGCRYGDYQETEFTFALSFEVPAQGNPNMIQQRPLPTPAPHASAPPPQTEP
jgi:hypothetical protein